MTLNSKQLRTADLMPAEPAAAPAGGKPNILIILADDVGWSDLGCYGGEIATPSFSPVGRRPRNHLL